MPCKAPVRRERDVPWPPSASSLAAVSRHPQPSAAHLQVPGFPGGWGAGNTLVRSAFRVRDLETAPCLTPGPTPGSRCQALWGDPARLARKLPEWHQGPKSPTLILHIGRWPRQDGWETGQRGPGFWPRPGRRPGWCHRLSLPGLGSEVSAGWWKEGGPGPPRQSGEPFLRKPEKCQSYLLTAPHRRCRQGQEQSQALLAGSTELPPTLAA